MWWSIGGGIIIFALGMFIFLKPGLIWKLTEEWKSYRADEPSEFYLKATKNWWQPMTQKYIDTCKPKLILHKSDVKFTK